MNKQISMKDYVSEDGTYIIPVSWSVYSTIRVKADNLEDAVNKAKEHIEELPCPEEHQYIEETYSVDVDTDEDALNAQEYQEMSGTLFEWE